MDNDKEPLESEEEAMVQGDPMSMLRAISLALDAARPGDCVLIAGKGHETYQEFADATVPFDDREVARELLSLKSLRLR